MNGINFGQISERFWTFWNNFLKRVDEEGSPNYSREKVVVFIVAIILALCLWFLINLGRTYVLNVNLPIEIGGVPEGQALAEDVPEFVTVSMQGEGWKLLSLYNNPPPIAVDVTGGEISLFDQVQQQMNGISVQKVQPMVLSVDLEESVSKTVPLRSDVYVSFAGQHNFLGPPDISPDSVTITGASSVVNEISYWETDSVAIEEVREDISTNVSLKNPEKLVTLSINTVRFSANVAEFTEGESRVLVRTRNFPPGQNITLSPSYVTVRYTVPIQEYADVTELNPFTAYVTYSMIQQDSTGFISPQIEVTAGDYHIRVQSHQPEKLAYFLIVEG